MDKFQAAVGLVTVVIGNIGGIYAMMQQVRRDWESKNYTQACAHVFTEAYYLMGTALANPNLRAMLEAQLQKEAQTNFGITLPQDKINSIITSAFHKADADRQSGIEIAKTG